LEFCSGPFHGRENSSEFRSEAVSNKNILFAGAGFFVKLIFFIPFPSVQSLGIDSSVNLGMPRNEHFLPRNNKNNSAEFFGTKFRCQPYSRLDESLQGYFFVFVSNPFFSLIIDTFQSHAVLL
jgi:hypothetical protein